MSERNRNGDPYIHSVLGGTYVLGILLPLMRDDQALAEVIAHAVERHAQTGDTMLGSFLYENRVWLIFVKGTA